MAPNRSTDRRTLERIAFSLDTPPSLAPVLAELFAPLASLGAMPRRAAAVIARHLPKGNGRPPRVLDAACGKGAVSIALAKRHACRVVGFDAFKPFIEEARRRAAIAGVSSRCRFEPRTAEAFFRDRHRFDAAMMLNLWPAPRAARALRRVVRPGGVYLIDDAFLDPRRMKPGDERTLDGAPGVAAITSAIERTGDRVVEVLVPRPAEVRRLNDRLFAQISASAAELSRKHAGIPRLKKGIRDLLQRQRRANELLAGPLRPAMWLVERRRDAPQS